MKYQTMFERDLLTVFSYLLLGFFMLSRSVLAPFISYRSAENPEDTAVLGFHVTLSAVGIILVGVFWKRISSKYSGKYLLYSSSGLLAMGAAGLAARSLILTLLASFLLGAAGSVLNILVSSSLSDYHGENKKIAIGEAAVVSGLFGALAPALLSLAESSSGLGWRSGLALPGLLLIVLFCLYSRTQLETFLARPSADDGRRGASLPRIFWCWLLLSVLCGATEWSMIFWSSVLIRSSTQLDENISIFSVSLIIVFQIIGRIFWTQLSKKVELEKLLICCLVLTCAGIFTFFLSSLNGASLILIALSIFIFSIGVSGTGQFIIVQLVETSRQEASVAMSRFSLASGASVLIFPWLMGAQASKYGIETAFLIPVTCSVLSLLLCVCLYYSGQRRKAAVS